MNGVVVLAAWLTPVVSFTVAASAAGGGRHGVWLGLCAMLAPLVALLIGSTRGPRDDPPGQKLVVPIVVCLLLWANLALAAELAAGLGHPRWHGIALIAVPSLLLVAVPSGARRAGAVLVVIALVALVLPLVTSAQMARLDPRAAWAAVAARPSFVFPPGSPWVTTGRDLAPSHAHSSVIRLEEEQRVVAPSGAAIRVLMRDGAHETRQDWTLGPGQAATLRPGDRIEPTAGTRLRFEAGRRVPGAPAGGAAWAEGGPPSRAHRLGIAVTLLGGAIALLSPRRFAVPSRTTVVIAGVGLLIGVACAEAWGVYGVLLAPDLFLGGVSPARMLDVPVLAFGGGPAGARVQGVLLIGVAAGFLAAASALIERTESAVEGSSLWLGAGAAVLLAAALAGALPDFDPWTVALLGLGAAASSLAPAILVGDARPASARASSALGLAIFAVISVLRHGHGTTGGALTILDHPAMVAAPLSFGIVWLGRR